MFKIAAKHSDEVQEGYNVPYGENVCISFIVFRHDL